MNKILALFIILVLLSGCEKQQQPEYPIAVAWNNSYYLVSVEEIQLQDLGRQLGEVKRIKTPMPLTNGDANFSISIGSKIFEINGIDINDAIAIEENGKIIKATNHGSVK